MIIACDFQSSAEVFGFLDLFPEEKPFVKIGMELFYAEGPQIVREIKARGGSVFVRSVYLQGLLFKPAAELGEKFAPVLAVRTELERLSREAGMAPAELYFRYLLSLPMVDCVLTGVDSVSQLEQNLEMASRGALPADVLAEIGRLVPELPEKYLRPACWNTL